jgi:hypothetical protein
MMSLGELPQGGTAVQRYDLALGDYVVTSGAVNGVEGEVISVRTDKGTRVQAWRATTSDAADSQAGCLAHGYSLETYEPFGYSVVSGLELKRVLADEFVRLGELVPAADLHLRRDDLLVWWSGLEAVHSAIVEVPIVDTATRRINQQATIVSSRSASGMLQSAVSLAFVKREHPSAKVIEAYRKA